MLAREMLEGVMRRGAFAFSLLFLAAPAAAFADGLSVGTYDCAIQPQGTMKTLDIGVLKVTPEGFSGPAAADADAGLYVYLLSPDNSVNWPVEFARNVKDGAEVVDATYYPFLEVVQTNITMTDGTTASVACGLRPE